MQKINLNISTNKVLTDEERIKSINDDIGHLNEEDGINCPICKNKGYIYIIDEEGYEKYKTCECMKKRKIFQKLNNSGITKETLKKYTFDNFKENDLWQTNLKKRVIEYTHRIINGNKEWLVISSITGSGKTHLCTATFQEIIKNTTLNGEYILWNDFVSKIIPMSKSFYEDISNKYEETLNHICNIDLLYIDDLLKLTDNKYNNDAISLLYKIINHRYINNKITIISTEYYPQDLENVDMAIVGRINEKCDFGKWWLTVKKDPNRNYRMKKREEI